MEINIKDTASMISFGERIAGCILGGLIIELVGDVGAGKTTLVKGIAKGLGVVDTIQSPSFTISRVYDCSNGLSLHHYDFYRLADAGIMANELSEVVNDPLNITIIEWGGAVDDILDKDRLVININSTLEDTRNIKITAGGLKSQTVLNGLK